MQLFGIDSHSRSSSRSWPLSSSSNAGWCSAIWLYLRFTLSYRDVEELLAERGLDVSYEQRCGAGC